MTFLTNPYRFGGPPPPIIVPGDRVLATRTSTASTTPPAALPYAAADAYDTFGGHDPAVNNTRITFPASGLVRLGGNIEVDQGGNSFGMRKNGAVFPGRPRARRSLASLDLCNLKSGPLVISAADYVELFHETFDTTNVGAVGNWFFAEYLDPALKYALVSKTTGQAAGPSAGATISWDAEEADTSAWHDNVTNNARLTVPSGVSRVRVVACISTTRGAGTGSDILFMTIQKNGAETAHGIGSQSRVQQSIGFLNIASAPMDVVPGDFFTVAIFTDSATTIEPGGLSWFAIEEIPASYKCVLASRSTNQSIPSATPTIIQWNDEIYDDDNMHSTSVNPSRLVVPAGATRARLSFNVISNPLNGNISGRVLKNGAFVPGLPSDRRSDGGGSGRANGMGAWVDVVPGDYFEAEFFSGILSANIGNSPLNWFAMEVI